VGGTPATPTTTRVSVNFDNATAGALPTGWTALAGAWKVEANATAPSAPNVLRQSQTDLPFPLVVDSQAGILGDVKVSARFNVLSGEKAQAGGVAFRVADKDNYYAARANGNEGNFALFHTIGGKREKLMEAESPTGTHTWLSITAEAKGKDITVWSGATKLFTYTETAANAPAAGMVGLWTKDDSVTLFDDFSAEGALASATGAPPAVNPGPAAKRDSFDTATVGAAPAGWTVVAGTWKVEANQSAPSRPNLARQSARDLNETWMVFTSAGNYTDVEASVAFNVQAGEKAQAGGILFRYKDASNYYVARYNHNEGMWNLFRTIEGKREKFAPIESTLTDFHGALDMWIPMRIEAKGTHVQVFSGAMKVLDYNETAANAPTSGLVGLWARYDSVTLFDDFEVEAI
jgi:hypothetical protein